MSQEKISGIVKRVTFHSSETGWSVLRVNPFGSSQHEITVIVHQSKVFAGATMDFYGIWVNHPSFGQQFKAQRTVERKPATTNALEKYLGSGLIKGVGPKTARKIVKHFGKDTLRIFEQDIEQLLEVPGIAHRKLADIQQAWTEHQHIMEIMIFLQSHGISTLFAVKIYKTYGHKAINVVQRNPYQLVNDIYGIGFLSADKVALSIGLSKGATQRVQAGIKHVLQQARDEGHCYLTKEQVTEQAHLLLELDDAQRVESELWIMEKADELMTRTVQVSPDQDGTAYYAHSLYYDEDYVAKKVALMAEKKFPVNQTSVERWIAHYCAQNSLNLSEEQKRSVYQVVSSRISILTGGPGCGKTTTTKIIVDLLKAMRKSIMLAAPTGRAAKRMTEVIGTEAKTVHRLLDWDPSQGGFRRNENNPLACDFLIVDECSMLDVHLAASLLRAVPAKTQLLLVGDADQLPSVGPGHVFQDIISSDKVTCIRLTKVFRQAHEAQIIQYAHDINQGKTPHIPTPFKDPGLWQNGSDCMFIDAEEATKEQLRFINKVRKYFSAPDQKLPMAAEEESPYHSRPQEFYVPEKFLYIDIDEVVKAEQETDQLKAVVRSLPLHSSLHWGLIASQMVERLYRDTLPKYMGSGCEIQILSPMTKGSLGTHKLNQLIQQAINAKTPLQGELTFGGRIFRQGDRVIQNRNNYDLQVYNGDIGHIAAVDAVEMQCTVSFNGSDGDKEVVYDKSSLSELDLAYAITIHKSQGSEFECVIIPLLNQHYSMLYRNLIYTALTRAKRMAIFVGSRRALATAVSQQNSKQRQTALKTLISDYSEMNL